MDGSTGETFIAALNNPNYHNKLGLDRTERFSGVGANASQSLKRILDDIACVLVSQPQKEVVAVCFTTHDDNIDVYIASNGSDLEPARTHLEDTWERLRALSAGLDPKDKVESHSDLRSMIYSFCWQKYSRMLKKPRQLSQLDVFFESVLEKKHYLQDDARPKLSVTDEEMKYVAELRLLARLFPDLPDPTEAGFAPFIKSLPAYHAWVSREGLYSDSPTSFMGRCHTIHEVSNLPSNLTNTLKPFLKFWRKVFSIEDAIESLLHIPHSKSLRRLLNHKLTVQIVVSPPRHLHYDFQHESFVKSSDLRYAHADLIDDFKDAELPLSEDLRTVPHSECTLLAHLQNATLSHLTSGYIGVSKLSCLGCYLYFSAYNQAAKKCGLPPFLTRGGRHGIYRAWVKPEITLASLDEEIERELVIKAGDKLLRAMPYRHDFIGEYRSPPTKDLAELCRTLEAFIEAHGLSASSGEG